MTTDPFTEAAREEACRYHWELREGGDLYYPPLDFGQHMAEWARTHLAAQEPDEEEVRAAATECVKFLFLTAPERPWEDSEVVEQWEPMARTALRSARAVRRDEENR